MVEKDRNAALVLQFCTTFLEKWSRGINADLEDAPISVKRICKDLLSNHFRYRGFINEFISEMTDNRKPEIMVKHILDCAITQLIFQDGIMREHAVNAVVEFAKKKTPKAFGFVNGVLRSFLREYGKHLGKEPIKDLRKIFGKRFNEYFLGQKLYQSWQEKFTENQLKSIIEVLQNETGLTVRKAKDFSGEIPEFLVPFFPNFNIYGQEIYHCSSPERFFQSDALQNFYVQDAATLIAGGMVPVIGENLVIGDFCAAPGGKSVIIAEKLGENGTLYSCDISLHRLKILEKNLEKFSNVRIEQNDILNAKYTNEFFDAILLDVPCSNTGVIRKKADAKWRYSKKNVRELVALQEQMLEKVVPLLKKGGSIIYSTCSVEAEENELQIANFLQKHPEFSLIDENFLMPNLEHDGSYAAHLKFNK